MVYFPESRGWICKAENASIFMHLTPVVLMLLDDFFCMRESLRLDASVTHIHLN
jgi:hypothetical protein